MILACTLLLLMSISNVQMADPSYSESSNAPSNPPSPSGQGTAVGAFAVYFKCFATKALHCTLYHTVELAWHKPWSHHPTSRVVPGQRARFWPNVHIALVEGQHRGRTPGLHRGPTLMGSDPTRGRQCGHTGSTRRPGINGGQGTVVPQERRFRAPEQGGRG